jgi:hypothetical protein
VARETPSFSKVFRTGRFSQFAHFKYPCSLSQSIITLVTSDVTERASSFAAFISCERGRMGDFRLCGLRRRQIFYGKFPPLFGNDGALFGARGEAGLQAGVGGQDEQGEKILDNFASSGCGGRSCGAMGSGDGSAVFLVRCCVFPAAARELLRTFDKLGEGGCRHEGGDFGCNYRRDSNLGSGIHGPYNRVPQLF